MLLKRLFDLVLVVIFLPFIIPLFIFVAVLIKIGSPGPIFYRGLRTGRYGKEFRIFKFRTMVADAEKLGGGTTGFRDPRVTQLGSFLRKYKLDELPQLFNILVGEMSFVGPRPELPIYTKLFTGDEIRILSVPPGITDYSSIQFSSLDEVVGSQNVDEVFETKVLPEKNKLRVRYVNERSFLVDLKIICLTAVAILKKLRAQSRAVEPSYGRKA